MKRHLIFCLATLISTAVAGADPLEWSLTNHAGTYRNEPVRLGVRPKGDFDPTRIVVREDGEHVPYQFEILERTRRGAKLGDIWVMTNIDPAESHDYQVIADASPRTFRSDVSLETGKDDHVTLTNGLVTVKINAGIPGDQIGKPLEDGPIVDMSWKDVKGRRTQSRFRTDLKLKAVKTAPLGSGPLFAKCRVRYEFEPTEEIEKPFAQFVFTVWRGRPWVEVEESHRMNEGDGWQMDLSHGWGVKKGLMRRWFKAPFSPAGGLEEVDLKPNDRLGDTLMNLQPRWTQAFDEGWFFGAHDGRDVLGALVLRAGKWVWPHENLPQVKVDKSGRYAGLWCPTARGSRYWVLLAGGKEMVETAEVPHPRRKGKTRKEDRLKNLAWKLGFFPLDKLTHEYVLEWEGLKPGGFAGMDYYSNMMNPSGPMRGMGRAAVREAQKGSFKPSRGNLSRVQVMFDDDAFGSYWKYWSPINPNFYTDFMRTPIAKACTLKDHPQFSRLRKMAEDHFRTDLFFSVTLPGGAGQECPGYLAHAMKSWKVLAPVCRKHLGFDPTKWPRMKAAASFLLHTSQPLGGGKRRILPLGDTHPTGPDVQKLAKEFGAHEDVRRFRTEELPGFGVVFRSHPGTVRENFLAFKSGPNRGHNHGDQLSFHYCADARPVAIDHMCSYSPRADQEHMHNRVAFTAGDFKYANMDGYERVLALETSRDVDVAVGQVESSRLREQPKVPQDVKWDPVGPYLRFDTPLVYRRTVVMMKDPDGKAKDYFVVRDQHWGPKVKATYCLHVDSDKADRKGGRINFGNMTLFCATPEKFDYERFDWSFSKGKGGKGYSEKTVGVRLTVKGESTQFITVLFPSGNAPQMEAIPNGVRIRHPRGGVDEVLFGDEPAEKGGKTPLVIVKRGGKARTVLQADDIDYDRSQGKVGLFVPDCGYDFGPIPGWLRRQRTFDKEEVLGK